MAKKTVQVSVHCSGPKNVGKLEIRVKPWRIGVEPGQDSVQWVATAGGAPITNFQVKPYDLGTWPFPSGGVYSGTNPHTPVARASAVPHSQHDYDLVVTFTDDQGFVRSATIDPDMVIEA